MYDENKKINDFRNNIKNVVNMIKKIKETNQLVNKVIV